MIAIDEFGAGDSTFVPCEESVAKQTMLLTKLAQFIEQVKEWDGAVTRPDRSRMFGEALEGLIELSGSEYGYIGDIRVDDETGQRFLKTYAITNIAWDDATREFFLENSPTGMEFKNLDSLFGFGIKNKVTVLSHAPGEDPRSSGLPAGHPPLLAYLGQALFVEDEMVGQLGLSNRAGSYDTAIIEFMRPIFERIAELIQLCRLSMPKASA